MIDGFAVLDLETSEMASRRTKAKNKRSARIVKTTLETVRSSREPVRGVTAFSGYAQHGAIAVTPLHCEACRLGSSLDLIWCETLRDDGEGTKAVKVWICLADAELLGVWEEYLSCLSEGESGQ